MKRLDLWNIEQKLRKLSRKYERMAEDIDGKQSKAYYNGAADGLNLATVQIKKYRLTAVGRTELYKRKRKIKHEAKTRNQ